MLAFPFSALHLVAVAVINWIKQLPKPTTGFVETDLVLDVTRSKRELIAENALLRQQLIILRRGQKRPPISNRDRLKLLFWARFTPNWKQVLHIVQPETLLRWHRDLFRLAWRWKSRATTRRPRVSQQVIALINRMASENLTRSAERIRGELLKLGVNLSKRTIQKYLTKARIPSPSGQSRTWFNHFANEMAPMVKEEHARRRAKRPKRRGRPKATVVTGYLMALRSHGVNGDDSVMQKVRGKKMGGLGYHYSSTAEKTVAGHCMCCWGGGEPPGSPVGAANVLKMASDSWTHWTTRNMAAT